MVLKDKGSSKTREAQLRFVYSLSIQVKKENNSIVSVFDHLSIDNQSKLFCWKHTLNKKQFIQACCSALLFILPLLLLFFGLVIFRVPFFPGWLLPGWLLAPFRVVMLVNQIPIHTNHSPISACVHKLFYSTFNSVLVKESLVHSGIQFVKYFDQDLDTAITSCSWNCK